MLTSTIGYMAGITTAVALTPQVIKSWKTRSTKDISLVWTLIYLLSMSLWIMYGALLKETPMVVMFSVETMLYLILITLKIKHG